MLRIKFFPHLFDFVLKLVTTKDDDLSVRGPSCSTLTIGSGFLFWNNNELCSFFTKIPVSRHVHSLDLTRGPIKLLC